jgi:coiled-coil domain-containing protein 12
MSTHEKLSAAANDRKARLAQLKSLKRKQAPDSDASEDGPSGSASTALTRTEPSEDEPSITSTYLSGRNFDPTTRNVKLGFEATPISDQTKTLEYKAEQLALESRKEQEAEKIEDKPLDLFKLQPKKPNWDLKRDLEAKLKPLHVQTENAIARLVRERVEGQKKEKVTKEDANGEKQEVGMEGSELVEVMHLKEKEEEEERRRDAEDEDAS